MTPLEKAAAWAGIGSFTIAALIFAGFEFRGSQAAVSQQVEPQIAHEPRSESYSPSSTAPSATPAPSQSLLQYDLENTSGNTDFSTILGGQITFLPNVMTAAGTMNGKAFEHALITQGTLENEWPTSGKFKHLTGIFGVDDDAQPKTLIRYVIRCDADRIIQNFEVSQGHPRDITVDISGCFHVSISAVSERPNQWQAGIIGNAAVTTN